MPETDEDLHGYISAYLGFDIPTVAVCDTLGHVAPFSVIADLFFHRIANVIVLANRTGGKTLNLAILHHLNSVLKPGCETVHLGAIKQQAFKCKEYASAFSRNEWFRHDRIAEVRATIRYTNKSVLEVVTGTSSGVNCLVGETVIDVLDAKGKWRLADLVGREGFWVHGYSPELASFIPALVKRVWKVGRAKVFRLIHDQGELIGTADHLVMLWDGSYKRLVDLEPAERLRPLYRRVNDAYGSKSNYWALSIQPGIQIAEHLWFAQSVWGIPSGYQVHHIDGNGFNNDPENLEIVTRERHARIHNKGTGNAWWGKKRPKHAALMRELRASNLWDSAIKNQPNTWRNQCMSAQDDRPWWDRDLLYREFVIEGLADAEIAERHGWNKNTIKSTRRQLGITAAMREEDNHKVVLVEPYGEADVYDMEVYPTHNFVANGIVVHNSPHPQISSFDEVELMKWQVLQEGFSMAMTKGGIPATQILASTRKDQAGNMSELADRVSEDPYFPFIMRSWCLFEVLENCAGKVTCDDCKSIVRISSAGEQESWYSFCEGRGERSRGFFTIGDAHTKFVTLDPATFDSQWACLIAGGKGMVFPNYRDMSPHVQRFEVDSGWQIIPFMDFGFDKPGCSLFIGRNPETGDLYVFGEHYQDHLPIDPGWDKVLREQFNTYGIPKSSEIRADARGDSEIRQIRGLGYKIRGVAAPIKQGLNRLYVLLSNTVMERHPALIIHPECRNLRRELRSLGYSIGNDGRPNTDTIKGDDHAVDLLRYALKAFGIMEEHERPIRIHSTSDAPMDVPEMPTGGWTIPNMRVNKPRAPGPGIVIPSRMRRG